jgi:hypothetical protein
MVAVGGKSLPQKTIYPVCRDNFTHLGSDIRDENCLQIACPACDKLRSITRLRRFQALR